MRYQLVFIEIVWRTDDVFYYSAWYISGRVNNLGLLDLISLYNELGALFNLGKKRELDFKRRLAVLRAVIMCGRCGTRCNKQLDKPTGCMYACGFRDCPNIVVQCVTVTVIHTFRQSRPVASAYVIFHSCTTFQRARCTRSLTIFRVTSS